MEEGSALTPIVGRLSASGGALPPCPLCQHPEHQDFGRDRFRSYLRCGDCALVYVPARYHLDEKAEKAEYDLHRNDPADPGYRRFLSRLVEPLLDRLPAACHGLDFGCGPGPTLSLMLQEAGHQVALFDTHYAPNASVLQKPYDFITATEVVEHLRQPALELEHLYTILKPGGILGIMTKLVRDRQAFAGWHYKNDRTHICFFSRQTFAWLAARWQAELEFIGNDVILLEKPA